MNWICIEGSIIRCHDDNYITNSSEIFYICHTLFFHSPLAPFWPVANIAKSKLLKPHSHFEKQHSDFDVHSDEKWWKMNEIRGETSSSFRGGGQFSLNFIRWRHRAFSIAVQLFRKRSQIKLASQHVRKWELFNFNHDADRKIRTDYK